MLEEFTALIARSGPQLAQIGQQLTSPAVAGGRHFKLRHRADADQGAAMFSTHGQGRGVANRRSRRVPREGEEHARAPPDGVDHRQGPLQDDRRASPAPAATPLAKVGKGNIRIGWPR
jgi:hypothetical protein